MAVAGLQALALLGTLLSPSGSTQDASPQAEETRVAAELGKKLLFMNFRFSGMSIVQDDKEIDIGFFGGNAPRYFEDVPEAMSAARTHRIKKLTGFMMSSLGLVSLIGGAGYMAANTEPNHVTGEGTFTGNKGLAIGLYGGGFLVMLVGALLSSSSNGDLSDAVNLHNAAVLNRIR